jgi:hypothetical protein
MSAMNPDVRTTSGRHPALYTGLVVAVVAPAVAVLTVILWHTAYPVSEGVAILEDVSDPSDLSFLWPTRSYYRPLLFLSIYAAWHAGDSPATLVMTSRLLIIAPVVILVGLLVVHLRPRNAVDAAAATLALAVLLGSSVFFDNLEIPLAYTTVGMPVLLGMWMLAERTQGPAPVALFLSLAVVAVGFKEQGLIVLPVVAAAWWLGAPGLRRTTVVWAIVFGIAYLGFRLATKSAWAPFEQHIGFGFTVLSAADAQARFGSFPLPVYGYNAVSTMLNLLFAEPTSGQFSITRAIVDGSAMPWQYLRLVSSAGLTCLIGWWGTRCAMRARNEGWAAESRTAAVLAVALLASGAMGFNYSRDRLGGMALVPYAVAAFYAVRALLETLRRAGVLRTAVTTIGLVLLMIAWQMRVVHMLDDARGRAADNHREWITSLYERRVEFAGRPNYLRALDALSPQGHIRPAGPLRYPTWVIRLLGPT